VAALLVAWRWTSLRAHGEPVGIDVGNWLALGRAVAGRHVSGSDSVYPPLVPLLVRGATALWDLPVAAALTAAIAGLAPGAGAWWATRRDIGDGWAGAVGVLLAVAGATSAAVAWGGLPQLFGLGIAPIAVVAAARLPGRPGPRPALALGALLTLLALVSPLVFGLGGLAAALACTLAAVVARARGWWRSALWVPVPLLVAVPIYWRFLDRASLGHGATVGSAGGAATLADAFTSATAAWVALGALALLAPIVTWRHRAHPLWSAATALTIVATASLLVGAEPRYACLAPTAAAIGAATLTAWSPKRVATLAAVGLVVAGAFVVVDAPSTMSRERDRYAAFVPDGTGDAVRWLRAHTRPDDLVAVAPVAGVPFGWIVEGWADRPSLVASDPVWLVFPGERARARTATRIFTASPWPTESSFAIARAAGAHWLYVPTAWHGIDPAALRRAEARHPGLVAFRGPGALVVRVPDGGTP
jgi:hypothetical protein